MTWIKLTEPGDSVTWQIAACEVDDSGNFPAIVFENDAGERLSMPQSTALQQLERCGFTPEQVPGTILTISRSDKVGANKRPYWNIDLTSGPPANGAKPAPRAAAPTPVAQPTATAIGRPAASWDALEATYKKCLRISYDNIHSIAGATVADIVAGAATLFIQASKAGLTVHPAPAVASYATVPPALEGEDDNDLPF